MTTSAALIAARGPVYHPPPPDSGPFSWTSVLIMVGVFAAVVLVIVFIAGRSKKTKRGRKRRSRS